MSQLLHTIWAVHEAQTLRQEIANTRKKLQEYTVTIVSLHDELRTLRESICSTCKRKFVPVNVISSQAAEPSSSLVNQFPLSKDTNSRFSSRPLLKVHDPGDFPTTASPTSEVQRSTTISQTFLQAPIPNLSTSASIPPVPCWSVERGATVLNVIFACTFNHKAEVQSVRFSADGKYLAAALSEWTKNGTIVIYDVETGRRICVLVEYASQYSSKARPGIHCACFSPDGRYLVAGDTAGRVTVWNVLNKRIHNKFGNLDGSVRSVDISPNGRLVGSTSWDGTVRIWNMRDGTAKVFTGNGQGSWSVRFSPNGRYVAAGNADGVLRMWDVRTGRLVQRWTGDKSFVLSVAYMPDGRGLVSGGCDGIKCWDISSLGIVPSSGEPEAILEYTGCTNAINSVAISPDARWIVSTSLNDTVILWDACNAVRQYTLIGQGDVVSSGDFSPAGTHLAIGSLDGRVTLWRYDSSRTIREAP